MEQKKHISAKTAAALVTAIRAEYGLPPYHHFDSGHAFFIGLARIKCKNRSYFLRDDVLRRAHKRAQKHVALFSSTPPAAQPAAKAGGPLTLVLNVNQVFYLKHAIDNADFSDMPDELGEPFSPYILMRLQGKIDDLYERALDLRAHSDQIIAALTAAQQ